MATICWCPVLLVTVYVGAIYIGTVRKVVFRAAVAFTYLLTQIVLVKCPHNSYGNRVRTITIGLFRLHAYQYTCHSFEGQVMTYERKFVIAWDFLHNLSLAYGPRRYFAFFYTRQKGVRYPMKTKGTIHTWR